MLHEFEAGAFITHTTRYGSLDPWQIEFKHHPLDRFKSRDYCTSGFYCLFCYKNEKFTDRYGNPPQLPIVFDIRNYIKTFSMVVSIYTMPTIYMYILYVQ